MTKDVLLSIAGLQTEFDTQIREEENEAVEIITPASYFFKNGKHYILYDEVAEGVSGVTKNKIKVKADEYVEITKNGIVSTHMQFEKSKKNQTYYSTPYGQLLVSTYTKELRVEESETLIHIKIDYDLEINHEPLAACEIDMKVQAKRK